MVGAVAGDDRAAGLRRRLPHDLDRVLVRVGTAEREEHATAVEPGEFEQALGERRTGLRTPGVRDETELLGLVANCGDDARVLVPEVAAFGQAAAVEHAATVFEVQPGAGATRDRRCVPMLLGAPAVEHGVSFGSQDRVVVFPGRRGPIIA